VSWEKRDLISKSAILFNNYY